MRRALSATVVVAAAVAGCNIITGAEDYEVVAPAAPVVPDAAPSSAPEIDAAPEEVPEAAAPAPAVDSGPETKFVFVSSAQYTANLGGISGADIKCKELADSAGLRGAMWRAWLSTASENAIDRIVHTGPYVLPNRTRVVDTKDQLEGKLITAIALTENGTPPLTPNGVDDSRVWTGTGVDGHALPDRCADWTSDSAAGLGVLGLFSETGGGFTLVPGPLGPTGGWGCQIQAHIYCFEL
jgi:hypothetical protein